MQGIIPRATVREPLLPVSDADRKSMRDAMVAAGELAQSVAAR
jgi:hypothetical protein